MVKTNIEILIKNKVEEVEVQLQTVLLEQDAGAIMKKYKKICFSLMYWIKLARHLRPDSNSFSTLASCISLVQMALDAAETEKYGQTLAYFSTLIKSYAKMVHKLPMSPVLRAKFTRHHLQLRLEQVDRCQYFKDTRTQISPTELCYLKSSHIQAFLSQLMIGQIRLPNSQCVCCSEFFLYDFPTSNTNPMIRCLVGVDANKITKVNLSKTIGAICNRGGGVLLCGATSSTDLVRVQGIRYQSPEEVSGHQKLIYETASTIIPPCYFHVERVLVHTNCLTLEQSPAHIAQEYMRICLRVLALPYHPSRTYFVRVSNKGFEDVYQLCQMGYPKEVNSSQHYTFMHSQYRNRLRYKIVVNSHQNIGCWKPSQNYSKAFAACALGNPSFMDLATQTGGKQKQKAVHEDEPKFAHQYASLLILGSMKDDRHVQNFEAMLSQNKKIFTLSKPFSESFQGGGRSIWMICHKFTFVELLNLMRVFEQKSEAGIIKVMGVFDHLEVNQEKLTGFYEEKLQNQFAKRYHKKLQRVETTLKNRVFYRFAGKGEALYAYLILESYQFKPYFVKQVPALQQKSSNH